MLIFNAMNIFFFNFRYQQMHITLVFCEGLLSIVSGIFGLIYYHKNSKFLNIFTYYMSNILTFICGIIIFAMSCGFLSKWFDYNTYNVEHYENQNHNRYYIFAIHWLVIIVSLLGSNCTVMALVSKNAKTDFNSSSQDFEMNSVSR